MSDYLRDQVQVRQRWAGGLRGGSCSSLALLLRLAPSGMALRENARHIGRSWNFSRMEEDLDAVAYSFDYLCSHSVSVSRALLRDAPFLL